MTAPHPFFRRFWAGGLAGLLLGLLAGLAPGAARADPAPAAAYLTPAPPQRLALLIGNNAYPSAPLPSAPLDVRKIEEVLTRAHFHFDRADDVKDFDALVNKALIPFLNKVKEGDIVVIYYFGHGFAHGADNFLVPVKASMSVSDGDVYEVFVPERVIRDLVARRKPGIAYLFLDACRTVVQFANGGAPPPLVPQAMPTPQISGDVIVSFAADYGNKAFAPEQGVTSYYTDALARSLEPPGVEMDEILRTLTFAVEHDSNSRQTPWTSQNRKSLFYFQPTPASEAAERTAWEAALQEGTMAAVEQYLVFHRGSAYAADARRWLADNPARQRLTYTRVMPLVPELSWNLDGRAISFSQLDSSLGVARTLKLAAGGRRPASVDDTSTDLLDLSSDVIVTRDTIAKFESGARGKGRFVRLPYGKQLEMTSTADGAIRAMTEFAKEAKTVILPRATASSAQKVAVGRSLSEIVLQPSKNLPSTVDPGVVREFMAPMLAPNRVIGWVSISTPVVGDERARGLLALQARFTKYLLTQMGVPEAKITIVEGLNSGVGGVRVRVFGI